MFHALLHQLRLEAYTRIPTQVESRSSEPL